MKVPQIKIETKQALIGINTQFAQVELSQPHAEISIKQPHAELNMETRQPKLTIDQTEAWRDMGMMSALDKTKDFATNARRKWLEGISRMSQEGNQMMKIEHGTTISQIAKQKTEPNIPMPNITYIPKSFNSIQIDYEPGEVIQNHKANKPIIDVQPKKPEGNYRPASVQIYLRQYPEINISVAYTG